MAAFHPKRLLGRMLFRLSEISPTLRPRLTRWGLRTRASWFAGRVAEARSASSGHRVKLASVGDNYLSFALYWRGLDYYEPLSTALVGKLAEGTGLFVDAGANIGFYSLRLAAARPDIPIVAFEPHPRLHALLAANVRANGFRRITTEQIALSDREGILPFYLNRSDMSSSLERGFDTNQEGVVSVPVMSLDGYLAQREAFSGRLLLKVDVEGHEPAFFAGAEQTLRRHRPDIIAEAAVPYPEHTIALLRSCGYHFHQITDEGLRPCAAPATFVRGPLVFLNCLLTTRPDAEVDALSAALREQARSIDLRKTSKLADPRVMERSRIGFGTVAAPVQAGLSVP
jgi:FkbM family methyltransferase